jgi:hypothetical protein
MTVAMEMVLRDFGLMGYMWQHMFAALDFPVIVDGQLTAV